MEKESEQFEKLTKELFELLRNDPKIETVEQNVLLEGIDGPRQIDVVIRGKVGPIDILTVVECKDNSRKVNIETVDAFHSVALDVKANKAIIVSSKGFSKNAISKAKRLGITLCTLHDVKYDKWKFHPGIPVTIEEIELLDLSDSYEFIATSTSPIIYPVFCNGIQIRDLFFNEWNSGKILKLEPDKLHCWEPNIDKPYRILNQDGEYVPINSLNVSYKTKKNIYFGYVGQLDYTKVIFFVDQKEGRMIFDENIGFNYREKFIKLNSKEKVPFNEKFSIKFCVRTAVKKISQPKYKIEPTIS
ncbi:MAG: restriction endonuclease [Ignavibacteriales bacterium]|nr:restriction endonuclease [Ignavibacteriales bacterium]